MSGTEITIVVPTYREAENLAILVPRIMGVAKEHRLAVEIIIVDDNSPDGTPEVCAKLAEEYPVRLHVRTTERGLSSAVIHGMKQAQGEIILVMDADLSHPPEKIPELAAEIRDNRADFVIGSRYVSGAGTDESWGMFRWLNSKVATILARPFTSAKDPMAGFFALKRTTFESARELNPIGYKIGLELIVKCNCRRVAEIPIHFSNRLHGESKLSFKEQVNYLRHLGRLAIFKMGKWGKPVFFMAVGLSGMVVDLILFQLLLSLLPSASNSPLHRGGSNNPFGTARALAIYAAMTWNYFWNRRLTFRDCARNDWMTQYVQFCVACSLGGVFNWATSYLLWKHVPFFQEYQILAAATGVAAGVFSNYLFSAGWVFRSERTSRI